MEAVIGECAVAEVRIPAGAAVLDGTLTLPHGTHDLVLFAYGSGGSRWSPRDRRVADCLHAAGMGTLLVDLLTADEDTDGAMRFDIPLLACRLSAAARWATRARHGAPAPRVGYFGASTGAAAALRAASEDIAVRAVVAGDGRPDLAGATTLMYVQAPTLLIVSGNEPEVLAQNPLAHAQLRCPKALEIVPGVTHLFPEPGALEHMAGLAVDWYRRWLRGDADRR